MAAVVPGPVRVRRLPEGCARPADGRLKDRYNCANYKAGCSSVVAGTLGGEEIDGLDPYIFALAVERMARLDGPDLNPTDDAAVAAARAEVAKLESAWRSGGSPAGGARPPRPASPGSRPA